MSIPEGVKVGDSIYVETPDGLRRAFLPLSGLKKLAKEVPESLPGGANGPTFVQGTARTYMFSMNILRIYFGIDWLQTYVMGRSAPTDFLRNDWADVDRQNTHMIRVIFLAEMIFNLQKSAGFDDVLDHIKGGQIESGFAELETAKMLHQYGIAFRFVKAQGVRRLDYDLEFFHHNGELICADTKCKIEGNDFTSSSIRNSLNQARDQLPKDKPGAIFVKVPQDWLENAQFFDDFEEIVKVFFRGTQRVVLVEAFCSKLWLDDKFINDQREGREVRNTNHRFLDRSRDWRLFTKYSEWPHESLSWIKFAAFFPIMAPYYRVEAKGSYA